MRRRTGLKRVCVRALALLTLALSALPATAPAFADDECEPGQEPDVIVSNVYETRRWGRVGDITAFSVGTYSCNIGDCELQWHANTNQHPVISGNMYRLLDGRFEQIGQSWLKHGFYALSGNLCQGGCIPTDGSHLGVQCSDPYSAYLNGEQDRLGPKFEVNGHTGVFPYPATDLYLEGDAIYKRLQVHNDDLEPLLNPGASYFIDSQYITADDAAAGNNNNNSSYRPVIVSGSNGTYNMSVTGTTQQEMPGIIAWADTDPDVKLTSVQVPGDGLFFIAAKVTPLGGDMWHYEYAIQNLNANRAAREFRLEILPDSNVSNIGFHDVDYHSGEPFDGTDWPGVLQTDNVPNVLFWQTSTYVMNPNANALRWDTLYNFRFDANLPAVQGHATLGLFLPGSPASMSVSTLVPAPCRVNGVCEPGEDVCVCIEDCDPPPSEAVCDDGLDDDCDGFIDCFDVDCCLGGACDFFDGDGDTVGICDDCNDRNPEIWSTPGEARNVYWRKVLGQLMLRWSAPSEPGCVQNDYEVLRSPAPDDFMGGATCLYPESPEFTNLLDPTIPASGDVFHYLIRAKSDCPLGDGPLGTDSEGVPREGAACP